MKVWFDGLKLYQKVLYCIAVMAFLFFLLIGFIFYVYLVLDAGQAELGYEEETRIEKRGWWE